MLLDSCSPEAKKRQAGLQSLLNGKLRMERSIPSCYKQCNVPHSPHRSLVSMAHQSVTIIMVANECESYTIAGTRPAMSVVWWVGHQSLLNWCLLKTGPWLSSIKVATNCEWNRQCPLATNNTMAPISGHHREEVRKYQTCHVGDDQGHQFLLNWCLLKTVPSL